MYQNVKHTCCTALFLLISPIVLYLSHCRHCLRSLIFQIISPLLSTSFYLITLRLDDDTDGMASDATLLTDNSDVEFFLVKIQILWQYDIPVLFTIKCTEKR